MDNQPHLNKIALSVTLVLAVLMLVVMFGTRQHSEVPSAEDAVTGKLATEKLVTEKVATEKLALQDLSFQDMAGEVTPADDMVNEVLVDAEVTAEETLVVDELTVDELDGTRRLQLPALEAVDYDWIAARIFENEAASQVRYLTFWGEGEDFPSFGIGHFIWFPTGVDAPFDEQFPDMVAYVSQRSAAEQPLPVWMRELLPFNAPWPDKAVFDQAWSTADMASLRDWLQATARWQARYIVSTFEKRWQALELPADQKSRLTALLQQLAGSAPGLFAIIDYYNFKGLGVNPRERYQGQGWGLVQVLQAMPAYQLEESPALGFSPPDDEALVAQFSQAAGERLSLRVELAPADRNEKRWLPGWLKRLQGYSTVSAALIE